MTTLKECMDYLEKEHAAGARYFRVTCNPIMRKIYIHCDAHSFVVDCSTRIETRMWKDILRDHVERLQSGEQLSNP